MFLLPMCINCAFITVIIVMCGSVIAAMSIYSLSIELVASIGLGALVFTLSFLAFTACMRRQFHRFDEWSRRIELYHQDVCHRVCWVIKENWRMLALMWILRCTGLFQHAEMLDEIMWGVYGLAQIPNAPVQSF